MLGQAFKLAIERRHLTSSPVIRHLPERNVRQGFFGDSELRSVIASLPEDLRDFVRFAYMTGWRRGEVASLSWQDVDGDVIRLRAENSKNGEGRSVILNGDLEALIKRRTAARSVKRDGAEVMVALVFHRDGQPIVDFRKAWSRACCAVGLGKMVCPVCQGEVVARQCAQCDRKWKQCELKYVGRILHDLRRTSVRNMVRAGVPERVAMSVSGHKTRSIFDRYNITSEKDLREAMLRTQDYLSKAAKRESAVRAIPVRRKAAN